MEHHYYGLPDEYREIASGGGSDQGSLVYLPLVIK
jgi:hypothetical protein